MKNRPLDSLRRLQDIEKAIETIRHYIATESCEGFCKNSLLHDAVLLQFLIIGEAIVHVSEEKLGKYGYPWYKVRSFRNLIAHEYYNIKLSAVWSIIEHDLPELEEMINKMIREEF